MMAKDTAGFSFISFSFIKTVLKFERTWLLFPVHWLYPNLVLHCFHVSSFTLSQHTAWLLDKVVSFVGSRDEG